MINIGIIGCGKIAQIRHIPEYKANPNAKIVALFDLNTERAEQLARELGRRHTRPIRRCWRTPRWMR